jgi:hypothetical protein
MTNLVSIVFCIFVVQHACILIVIVYLGGELIERDNKKYKIFYGMSSCTAMKRHVGGVAEYRYVLNTSYYTTCIMKAKILFFKDFILIPTINFKGHLKERLLRCHIVVMSMILHVIYWVECALPVPMLVL